MKKTPLNGKSKQPAAILRRKIDRLCSIVVRSCNECRACGFVHDDNRVYSCSQRLECAHIFSRGWLNLRHHPANMVSLCNIHHRYFTQNPDEWKRFIEMAYPGRLDWLYELRQDKDYEGQEYWLAYWNGELKKLKEAA